MLPVTVLGSPRSSYVRTVVLLCEEKLLGYLLEPHAPHSEEIIELNPYGKIPVLRHEGHTLYETLAITLYLNERFPGPDLMPPEPLERGLMLQWISVINSELYPALVKGWLLPRLGLITMGEDEVAANKAATNRLLKPLNEALAGCEFLVGEEISVADLFLFPILDYAYQLPDADEVLGDYQNLLQWHSAMTSRESVTALTRL